MRFFAAALIFFGAASTGAQAQAPEVPHKMQFAGMTLTIRDDARREIQKDVDALTMHGRYYTLKAERAKTYFPIIEKIFEEERVPADFKFLVLQESALVADAVSVSNAVGFWQFKDYTALSMGMRVDRQIDERMNIVSSTRGAAKYLKQNNAMFNNWLYALQSYQMGAGGVQRSVRDLQSGTQHMEVNSDTYWYVKKFLAHKVAFEGIGAADALIRVMPYQSAGSKTLKEIAVEVSSEESVLRDYNKWLKTDIVPADRDYVVLVPVGKLDGDFNKLVLSSTRASKATPVSSANVESAEVVRINDIMTIRARQGETVSVIATRAKISLTSFLKYNDIAIDHVVEPGALYLLGKKKNKGQQEFYKAKPGDNLWSVSQSAGVKIRRLMKYNRMEASDRFSSGATVWLSTVKTEADVIELEPDQDVVQLNEKEAFDWYLKSPVPAETVPVQPTSIVKSNEIVAPVKIEVSDPQPDLNVLTHVVKKGETYTSIAKEHGVSITDLLEWNNLDIQNGLKTGQVLSIKGSKTAITEDSVPPAVEKPQEVVHVVKASDTLYSIARQYGVTIRDLMEWNNKKDFTLSVGESLKINKK